MSAVQHTPAPWRAECIGVDFIIGYNDAGNWLAQVYDDGNTNPGQTKADAHLIAAAPELLEASPDLSHVISWLENGCDPLKARDELVIYQSRIDAAVAKAEGRQP